MKINLDGVSAEQRGEAEELLKAFAKMVERNPLHAFQPHCAEQRKFLEARTPVVAAFAGNQSGKSTIMAVRTLIQVLMDKWVPEHLMPYKIFHDVVHCWILCPSEEKIYDSVLPALLKWCPKSALVGGSRAKAFNGSRMELSLANGSTIGFKTYKQDSSVLGGATLHFVCYDEPPPRAHRDEAATRTLAVKDSFEMYAMTPLKTNTGWIRRDIWKKREDPEITVCKWSMHDNPALDPARRDMLLDSYKNDLWRRAREFGDFMDVAGLVYAGFERCVPDDPISPSQLKLLDHVWGIDPGIRNAAIVCGGFDGHGVNHVYDEQLIQNGTPSQYAQAIDLLAAKHGMRREDILFVIDPAARQRSQATGDTVQSELARVGIFTMNGTNDREAGQQQIRDRILHQRLVVYPNCLGLRDDADELAWEMDDDEDTIGPADDSQFHRLATLRYQCMVRPYYPHMEATAPERNLGYRYNKAMDLRHLAPKRAQPPMGTMS